MDKATPNDLKTLRAPSAGCTCRQVGVTTLGGVVTPAQNLVTIVPDDTPAYHRAPTPRTTTSAMCTLGKKVEIKDTFPFQKYGDPLAGTLVW